MNITRKRSGAVAAAAATATAAGMLLLGAGAAHATTAVPWEPDTNASGTITFYDANGNVVTHDDSANAPLPAYAVGSDKPATFNAASLLFAAPDPANPNTLTWFKQAPGGFTTNPPTGLPAAVQAAATAGHPVVVDNPGSDDTPGNFVTTEIPPQTATGYANVVQIRLRNSVGQKSAVAYDTADLLVNPATGSWTQVYPAPLTQTTTTVSSSENPATVGDAVTYSAKVVEQGTTTALTAGTVQFDDGSTPIGSATVGSTGTATLTPAITYTATGSHSITAVFTPATSDTGHAGSTSTALVETVNPASTPTTTGLAVSQDGTAGDPATLTATVTGPGTTPNNAGTVSFFDGSSTTPLNATPVTSTTGSYVLTLPTGFTAGPHTITAKFTPTDLTQFEASQATAPAFITQPAQVGACAVAGSKCTDDQGVEVTVPTGTITITTPYTAANPLDLGTMGYDTTTNQFTANGGFQNIVVTDHRSGGAGYTVSALSTALSGPGSTINAENVGLTNVVSTPGTGFVGTIAGSNNPAASPAVAPGDTGSQGLGGTTTHTVFTASGNTAGSVTVNGLLTINAPSSTKAGLFTGTITFTVG
jgi:hypothetical protein